MNSVHLLPLSSNSSPCPVPAWKNWQELPFPLHIPVVYFLMPYDLQLMAQAKAYLICLDFREIILGAIESVTLNYKAAY